MLFCAVIRSHVKLSKWLKGNGMPPPLLPMVCGYTPLASDILQALQEGWGGKEPPAPPRPPAAVAGGSGERAGEAGPALETEAAIKAAAARRRFRSRIAPASGPVSKQEVIDDADSPAR